MSETPQKQRGLIIQYIEDRLKAPWTKDRVKKISIKVGTPIIFIVLASWYYEKRILYNRAYDESQTLLKAEYKRLKEDWDSRQP